MLEELAREIEAKITALRNRNIIDDEQYYRIKSLVDHPELIKGLEVAIADAIAVKLGNILDNYVMVS